MKEELERARKAIALGRAALRNGAWELGLTWYAYGIGILTTLFSLGQSGQIETTEEHDLFMASLLTQLEDQMDRIKAEWGNGHRNPPNRALSKAADAMLKELEKFA